MNIADPPPLRTRMILETGCRSSTSHTSSWIQCGMLLVATLFYPDYLTYFIAKRHMGLRSRRAILRLLCLASAYQTAMIQALNHGNVDSG